MKSYTRLCLMSLVLLLCCLGADDGGCSDSSVRLLTGSSVLPRVSSDCRALVRRGAESWSYCVRFASAACKEEIYQMVPQVTEILQTFYRSQGCSMLRCRFGTHSVQSETEYEEYYCATCLAQGPDELEVCNKISATIHVAELIKRIFEP
jgi:hypothetical protein